MSQTRFEDTESDITIAIADFAPPSVTERR
jgi:hypothetical protein